mmetsp:Transcript_50297/g.92971  ORF Transcript_50297/g.92971 Transcript_50297/m.92971 type:complete len:257 (+) Transcript_50297:715-1485(+)
MHVCNRSCASSKGSSGVAASQNCRSARSSLDRNSTECPFSLTASSMKSCSPRRRIEAYSSTPTLILMPERIKPASARKSCERTFIEWGLFCKAARANVRLASKDGATQSSAFQLCFTHWRQISKSLRKLSAIPCSAFQFAPATLTIRSLSFRSVCEAYAIDIPLHFAASNTTEGSERRLSSAYCMASPLLRTASRTSCLSRHNSSVANSKALPFCRAAERTKLRSARNGRGTTSRTRQSQPTAARQSASCIECAAP